MLTQEEKDEALKHQEVLRSIQVLLSQKHGRTFIEYLFESFGVGELPPVGLNDRDLVDYVSYLRAGNSIYKIVLEAEPTLTGHLITDIEKRRQDNVRAKTITDESSDRK